MKYSLHSMCDGNIVVAEVSGVPSSLSLQALLTFLQISTFLRLYLPFRPFRCRWKLGVSQGPVLNESGTTQLSVQIPYQTVCL